MPRATGTIESMIQAGMLTWLLPGLGHYRLGHRGLAVTFFVAISIPYALGLAIGGIKANINPWANPWLFLAEMGAGGYTSVGLLANCYVGDLDPRKLADPKYLNSIPRSEWGRYLPYLSFYPESDVAQIYLATAGLLNVLAILDALTRAQTGGLPTYYRELTRAPGGPGGGG